VVLCKSVSGKFHYTWMGTITLFFILSVLVSEGRGKGVSAHATKVYGAVDGQLHALPTSAIDGGEWSRPDHFTPWAHSPGPANWIECFVLAGNKTARNTQLHRYR